MTAHRAIEAKGDGFTVRVRLKPKSATDGIDGPGMDAAGSRFLKVRVRAAPEKGAANAALEVVLAKALGAPKSAVRVEKGATGRLKIVAVEAGADALDRAHALMNKTLLGQQ